jgi:hypothetical protein
VLFALVLQGLDFLPRREFLGVIIDRAEGGSLEAKRRFMLQVEQADIEFQPRFGFRVGVQNHQSKTVRPDARIATDDIFVVVEAKRPREGRFKPEQLAREYVTTVREANPKLPLLLLLVDEGPEVRVENTSGKTHIRQDIQDKLPNVLTKVESPADLDELLRIVDDVVAWTTWDVVTEVLREQLNTFDQSSPMYGTVKRLVGFTTDVIERHMKR